MPSLQDLLGFELRDIAGARLLGEIPVSEALINRLIAQRLAAKELPVTSLAIEAHDGGTLTAHVRLRSAFVPPLKVLLRIEQQPELPQSPVLVLRWTLGKLGALARMATPVLAGLNVLPPGIRVDGDLLGVDIGALLESRGYGEVLPHVAKLRVSTEPGRVVLWFETKVRV